MQDSIRITGARVHNLKNISLSIPKHQLVVITGLSGSGKSSLAFDTIYAEGQRRYAESLSSYARQFMEVADKPDLDEMTGLSPTIAIDQKTGSRNPRSTVGTVTEIYDYLRLLFSRLGIQYDPKTHEPIRVFTAGEIVEHARSRARAGELLILAPVVRQGHAHPKSLFSRLEQSGYETVRLNGVVMSLLSMKKIKFDPERRYDVELVVGKITDLKRQNIALLIDQAIDFSNGYAILFSEETAEEEMLSTKAFSKATGSEFPPIESRTFSFNSPYGACPRCTGLGYTMDVDRDLVIPNPRLTLAEGAIQPWTRIVGNHQQYGELLKVVAEENNFSLDVPVADLSSEVRELLFSGSGDREYILQGKKTRFSGIVANLLERHGGTDSEYIRREIEQYMIERTCPLCRGKRLKIESLFVRISGFSIADIVAMTVEEAREFFSPPNAHRTLLSELSKEQHPIAAPILKEIEKRLGHLLDVGLGYLTLDRSVTTLSGGEAQRIRLSTQLATGLSDVIYILDEPSIGLHPKDNQQLIDALKRLRDQGNSVLVVEHDAAMIETADFVIDVGPGAGVYGGEIVAVGTPGEIKKNRASLTGQYLSGVETIPLPEKYRKGSRKTIEVVGAKAFNLKNLTVSFPLGTLICVAGVSGSGKSSLVLDILSRALAKKLYRAKTEPASHKTIRGMSNIDKVISIDQTPIGRTPRSNPATYTSVFTAIRDVFATCSEARMRGLDPGVFSFNVKGGGRCETCAGQGYIDIPMQFLSDVFVGCPECHGARYNKEALEIHYRQKNIAEVLAMTVEEAASFFGDEPAIAEKLKLLRDVGLGYIHLGQSATTLSGGEAQRIKLATELSRRSTGKTLYILDEPTTGLHFADICRLLDVLQKLVDKGNTVIIIEHNMDVVKCADWVIDLGPGGGLHGGEIIAEGTPKEVARVSKSYTGMYLKTLLKNGGTRKGRS